MPLGFGSAARAVEDFGKDDAPAGAMFSSVQSVMNTISVLRAGLAQTSSEIDRISKEYGRDTLSDPQVFMKAYPRLKKRLVEDLALIRQSHQFSCG